MSSIFLSPEISIELFLEFLILLVMSFTVVQALLILKNKSRILDLEREYSLEKKSYLVGMLISVALIIKIILIVFFIYSLDELSDVIPGAMCVTGVIESNVFATPLLLLKIVVLLLVSLWFLLKKEDFKKKILYFLVLYIFIVIEFVLSFYFLSSIDTQTKVSCCSAKLIVEKNYLPFNILKSTLLYLFYASYLTVIVSAFYKQKIPLLIANTTFIYLSYYAIVYYFGAYIYGDVMHKCPFCMLKQEYNFIGYFIYSALFLSWYYSVVLVVSNRSKHTYKKVIFLSSFIVCVLSTYILIDVV